jgi:hypothetical protein
MNLLPLFLVATSGFGFSCLVFILRERRQNRLHAPAQVAPSRPRSNVARFPVSRLPSIYR